MCAALKVFDMAKGPHSPRRKIAKGLEKRCLSLPVTGGIWKGATSLWLLTCCHCCSERQRELACSRAYGLQPTSAIKHGDGYSGHMQDEMGGTCLLNIWQMREGGFQFGAFY